MVHADQFEKEVCKAGEIEQLSVGTRLAMPDQGNERSSTHYDGNHADSALPASEECGHKQYDNGDGYGSDRQRKFDGTFFHDDDDKLDGKPQEKEEIKLEKGDVDLKRMLAGSKDASDADSYLKGQIPPLHPQISTDMLVYRPRKLVI